MGIPNYIHFILPPGYGLRPGRHLPAGTCDISSAGYLPAPLVLLHEKGGGEFSRDTYTGNRRPWEKKKKTGLKKQTYLEKETNQTDMVSIYIFTLLYIWILPFIVCSVGWATQHSGWGGQSPFRVLVSRVLSLPSQYRSHTKTWNVWRSSTELGWIHSILPSFMDSAAPSLFLLLIYIERWSSLLLVRPFCPISGFGVVFT